jgi:hypothetical protein
MPLKIVIFYNQNQRGWTETYYSPSSSTPRDFIRAIRPISLSQFVKFRNKTVFLYGIRASVIGQNRNSFTSVFIGDQAITGLGDANDKTGPDVTTTDGFVDLYAANGAKRPLYLRGLNETDVNISIIGQPVPGANLTDGIQGMVATIKGQGWCIQQEQRPPNAALLWYPVTTVAPNNDLALITLFGTITFQGAAPYQVVFQGIPRDDLPGFPRMATVLGSVVAGGNTILTISYRVRNQGGGTYAPVKLKVTQVVNTYQPITDYDFVGFGERKTGRPIGVSRGRTRPAVRAQ